MRSLCLAVFCSACSGVAGTYRVDTSASLLASCTGVPSARAQTWAGALSADPVSDFAIGRDGADGAWVAETARTDGGRFATEIAEEADGSWAGERTTETVTVGTGGLGADFSALLETDGACTFDLRVATTLVERDAGEIWNGTTTVEVTESDDADGCDFVRCIAELDFAAVRSSYTNPGIE
jgi:hypothetical protein